MTAGLLLIAAALCLVLYNRWDSHRAGVASENAREVLLVSIEHKLSGSQSGSLPQSGGEGFQTPASGTAQVPDTPETLIQALQSRPTLPDEVPAVPVMPVEELDGESYIGLLEIPALNLSLPVIENWDYEKLKVAPCRYAGSYYMNDLVICAHNYQDHFASLQYIKVGEDVYFTNTDGEVIHYIVSNRQTVLPTQIDLMIDNTQETWDMTLFTCYTGGRTRCAVRCIRADD